MKHATRVVRACRASVRIGRAALVVGLVPVLALLGCPPASPPLAPSAGIPHYQRFAAIPVPGGLVNAAGGGRGRFGGGRSPARRSHDVAA